MTQSAKTTPGPVFYDGFAKREDLPTCYEIPPGAELVYAGYTYEDYSGSALVVYVSGGKWYENHDGHCSCNGLETWAPELGTRAAIAKYTGWPGLTEAVKAFRHGAARGPASYIAGGSNG